MCIRDTSFHARMRYATCWALTSSTCTNTSSNWPPIFPLRLRLSAVCAPPGRAPLVIDQGPSPSLRHNNLAARLTAAILCLQRRHRSALAPWPGTAWCNSRRNPFELSQSKMPAARKDPRVWRCTNAIYVDSAAPSCVLAPNPRQWKESQRAPASLLPELS